MKKLFSLLCALALFCSVLPAALAEPFSVDLDGYVGLNPVNGCVYQKAGRGDYYRLLDADGNQLTPEGAPYTDMSFYSGSTLVRVESESADGIHRKGLLDAQGKEIMPCIYADIEIISERWQAGVLLTPSSSGNKDYTFTNYSTDAKSYYRVQKVDFYFDGAFAGSLDRDHCDVTRYFTAYGAWLKITDQKGRVFFYDRTLAVSPRQASGYGEFDTEYKNSKTFYYHNGSGQQAFVPDCTLDPADLEDPYLYDNGVLYDIRGNMIAETAHKYDYIYDFVNGYARAKLDKKVGIINEQGEEIIPPEYDDIVLRYDEEPSAGYFSAVKDGKVGFLDLQGNVTCDFVYAQSAAKVQTPFAFVQDLTGDIIVLSAAAGELPARFADDIYNYNGAPVIAVKNADGQNGVIDLYGNELIPYTDDYNDFTISQDGTVILGSGGYSRPSTLWHFDSPYAPASLNPDGSLPVKPQTAPADETWACENGHEGNTGKFCTECGAPKPALQEPDDGTWTCENGHEGNTGKFCTECGAPKPAEAVPVTSCPSCGYEFGDSTPKFCPECGTPIA